MQVFKVILKLIRSKKSTIIVYVGIFLVLCGIFTNNGDPQKSFTTSKLDICIFDEDDSPESRALTELLYSTNKKVSVNNDKDAIIDALYYESADFILVIGKGYSEKLAVGETSELFESYHMHDSYAVVRMEQYLDEYVSSVSAYLIEGKTLSEATDLTAELMSTHTQVNMAKDEKISWLSDKYTFFWRYLPYIYLAITVTVLGLIFMAMNRKDIRFRTNCSCVKVSSYTAQMLAASMVFVIFLWLLTTIMGFVMCGMPTGRRWLGLLNSFVFIVISALIAALISSFGPSENILNLLAQVVGLSMSFFCGIFIDPNLLSDGVVKVSRFLPAYWYIRVVDMLCGGTKYSAGGLAQAFAMQLLFIVALGAMILAVRKSRARS